MKSALLFILAIAFAATNVQAQLNVGSTAQPDASAVLQATSISKGVLFPNLTTTQRDAIAAPAPGLVIFNSTTNQLEFNSGTAASKIWSAVGASGIGQQLPLVSLAATYLPAPLASHVTGVAVYNTATASNGATAVVPGIYVNDGTQWRLVMLAAPGPVAATFTPASIDCSGNLAGTYTATVATTAANTKAITINTATTGAYIATTNAQNGVSFAASGIIATTGSTSISFTASGTPAAAGTFTYTATIAGQTCTFPVTYALPAATFTAATINCSGTLAGTYTANTAMAASNTKMINITTATAGTYTATTDAQNGVTFAASGTIAATGSTAITFTASGLPATSGTFTYTATIAGQTCTFTVTYGVAAATYSAGTIDCSGNLSGTYATYTPMTASNTKTVFIGVVTAGTYTATTDTQNGVFFSASGTLNAGGPPRSIQLIASGTPTATGTFTHTITIGGQTCTFSVTYTASFATFVAGTINCNGALAGTYMIGTAMTAANRKTVNITVNNTGGFGAFSNAVNGVSFAPVASGVTATGINAIAFVASGTPLATGTFTHSITIGGGPSGQTCSFTVTYLAPPATFTPNSIDCSGSPAGNYFTTIPMAAGNTKTIGIDAATAGSYTASTDLQNGVSFSGLGSATVTGPSSLVMVGTGTPVAAGIFTYTATIAGQTCTFPVTFSGDVATFAPASIDCSGALSGSYSYLPCTSSNTKIISITPTAAGTYTATTNTVNGVSFTASGATAATGTTTVTLTASGTSIADGTFTYTVTIAGQSCTFPVTYTSPIATFAAGSFNCGGMLSGTYTTGVAMNSTNTKTTTITVLSPGTIRGTFTGGQVTNNPGVYFSPNTTAFPNTGNVSVIFTAVGTPATSGPGNVNLNLNGQNCSFSVTFASAPATFTAGTIDCSGTLSGTYVVNQSMAPPNKKVVNINAATTGPYTATTDTKNGVSFSSSGTITSTGSNAIQFSASGTPTAAGTFTYTATIGGQTCTFDVTYLPLATYNSINCSAAPSGVYSPGGIMTAANTKDFQVFAVTAGYYTASTATVNGVRFATTGTQATANTPATYTLTASGVANSAGTFFYNVAIGNQNCSFSITYATPVATLTGVDCSGTLAGSYNTGTAMAATNTKVVNVTATSTGSYSATTDIQNGVSFAATGTIAATGVSAVTLVASGTPAANGTFTYTLTVGGQTCQFAVVYIADGLRTALSTVGCASCTAYDGATANTWVPITGAEYAAFSTMVASTNVYATSEADMTSGTAVYSNSTGNQTTANLALPTVANSYIYGLSLEVATSAANQGFQVKAVPIAAPTGAVTNLPATGTVATITTAIAARTRVYFVLKQPTTPLAAASYIGGYPPNDMAVTFGLPLGAGVDSRYAAIGNVSSGMFVTSNSFRIQLLGTVTKQW